MEEQRVQKMLSARGYCSRRKAEELIDAGRVKVNGVVVKLGNKATDQDKIEVDGKPVLGQKFVYLMFNKPVGCVTALTDPEYKTVMDYIKIPERVFPIGRLDYNTSGLLLLTNDGDFANGIMHPRYEIKKTYRVGIDKAITDSQIAKLEAGVMLEDGKTSPAKIKKNRDNEVEITIHEGKKRIVRRMFQSLGFRMRFLERIKVGKLELGNLKLGEYRAIPIQPGKDKPDV
ncbi:MAG: pseudouridine synthase [archaeon]